MSRTRSSRCRRVRDASASARLPRRAGVTLVELIIAIVLLAIGLLAMVGVSVAVMAQVTGAANQTVGASLIQSRFEPLERRSCTVIVPGSETYRGIEETWQTSTVASRARGVRDSVRFPDRRGRKTVAVGTVVSCVQ